MLMIPGATEGPHRKRLSDPRCRKNTLIAETSNTYSIFTTNFNALPVRLIKTDRTLVILEYDQKV